MSVDESGCKNTIDRIADERSVWCGLSNVIALSHGSDTSIDDEDGSVFDDAQGVVGGAEGFVAGDDSGCTEEETIRQGQGMVVGSVFPQGKPDGSSGYPCGTDEEWKSDTTMSMWSN
jgi:hypothetical protein